MKTVDSQSSFDKLSSLAHDFNVNGFLEVCDWAESEPCLQDSVARVREMLQSGMKIGFDDKELRQRALDERRWKNLTSALEHPEIIDHMLVTEIANGWIAGPFSMNTKTALQIRTSPIGLVPKTEEGRAIPGKFRRIFHLSYPVTGGVSVNDSIQVESFTMSAFEDCISYIKSCGPGCYLAKSDIDAAFRQIPVDIRDRRMFGFVWKDHLYVDLRLPFGSKSSPALFGHLAQVVLFGTRMLSGISTVTVFVDDFIFVGSSEDECNHALDCFLQVTSKMGVKVKLSKTFRPVRRLLILGVLFDTVDWTIGLSDIKRQVLLEQLHEVVQQKRCTLTSMRSLAGRLTWASSVIVAGRLFTRRLYNMIQTWKEGHQYNMWKGVRRDLNWWIQTLQMEESCQSPIHEEWIHDGDINLFTDASDWGYGAFFDGQYFYGEWSQEQRGLSINARELIAVVLSLKAWGPQLSGKQITVQCDNTSTIQAWTKRSTRSGEMLPWLYELHFVAARYGCGVRLCHVPGVENTLADCLSRFGQIGYPTKFQETCCSEGWDVVSRITPPHVQHRNW